MRYGNHLLHLWVRLCYVGVLAALALTSANAGTWTFDQVTPTGAVTEGRQKSLPSETGRFVLVKHSEVEDTDPDFHTISNVIPPDEQFLVSWSLHQEYVDGLAAPWVTYIDLVYEEPPLRPFYEASSGEFYNGSDITQSYVITFTAIDENGVPNSLQEQVDLGPNEFFQATARGGGEWKLSIAQLINGSVVNLGSVPRLVTGEFYEEDMPETVYTLQYGTGEPDNYQPPILAQEFNEADRGFPNSLINDLGWTIIEAPSTPIDPDATPQEIAAAQSDDRDTDARIDQLLWQRSEENQDARFEKLNQQQQARHDQDMVWQAEHADRLEKGFADMKNEFNESQLQGSETNEHLESIEGKLPKEEELVAQGQEAVGAIPGGVSKSDVTSFSQANADAKRDELLSEVGDSYGLADFTPTVSYDGSPPDSDPFKFQILQFTFDFNPFDEGEWGGAAYFLREFIIWATTLAVYIFSVKTIYSTTVDLAKTPFKQGSTELAIAAQPFGIGITVNLRAVFTFLGIVAVMGVTLSSPAILTALASSRIDGISWDIVQADPLQAVSPTVAAGANYVDQFIPIFHLVSVALTYLVIEGTKLPAFFSGYIIRQLAGII
ncbi:MAG: hypothetical protein AAFX93_20220 [Verrucomicrobiota bacterium]